MQGKHQGADNLGLGYLLSEPQLDSAAGPIAFQAVIDDCIWNCGSNEFGACAKLVRRFSRWPITLFPLDANRSIMGQPSDRNNALGRRPGTVFQRVRPQLVEDKAEHRDHLGGQKNPSAGSDEAVAGGCEGSATSTTSRGRRSRAKGSGTIEHCSRRSAALSMWLLGRLGLRHCLWIDQREHSRFATNSGYGEPAQH